MLATLLKFSTATTDTLAEPRLATNTSRESGVKARVRGSSPTAISLISLTPCASTKVIESLSGLTAATRAPSGETTTADEETGPEGSREAGTGMGVRVGAVTSGMSRLPQATKAHTSAGIKTINDLWTISKATRRPLSGYWFGSTNCRKLEEHRPVAAGSARAPSVTMVTTGRLCAWRNTISTEAVYYETDPEAPFSCAIQLVKCK